MRTAPLLLALTLTACSADIFVRIEGGITFDTGTPEGDANTEGDADAATAADASDARADGDAATVDANNSEAEAGCGMIWGATACDGIMNAFCTTTYNKCGGMTVMQCKAWWASNFPTDFDCTVAKYKKSVCAADANQCANVEIPSYQCGKLQSSTPSQLGGACTNFFGGF